jgi:phage/conjugal plasmid C-4 type zinc finger TraR family protein
VILLLGLPSNPPACRWFPAFGNQRQSVPGIRDVGKAQPGSYLGNTVQRHSKGKLMANGWARDGAVQDQIEDSITDMLESARARMPAGEGCDFCEDCGEPIPPARRLALPGARTCVPCQVKRDKQPGFSGINRRGSKDSQLR